MENDKKLPKEDLGDYAHTLTKGVLGAIPFAGSIASEAFGLIVTPPLKKRMDQWLENLYNDIEKLKENSDAYKPENLSKNEQFISTITGAAQIAIKTHNEEKLAALKNATVNSITKPDENFEQPLFLNLIDTLTPLHIKALKRCYKSSGGSIVKSYYDFSSPTFGDNYFDIDLSLIPSVLIDLENRGLIEKDFHSSSSSDRRIPPEHGFTVRASEFGNRFYEFITR